MEESVSEMTFHEDVTRRVGLSDAYAEQVAQLLSAHLGGRRP